MHSSHELASSYAIDFVISLYLILLIGIQTSNVMGTNLVPQSKRECRSRGDGQVSWQVSQSHYCALNGPSGESGMKFSCVIMLSNSLLSISSS